MSEAVATSTTPLDTKTVLARINQRIALLRAWISHDHHDEPYWWARRTTAPRAQAERERLRWVANLLHVDRAASRGRLHGTRFANVDEQAAWLSNHERSLGGFSSDLAGVPHDITLAALREGKL